MEPREASAQIVSIADRIDSSKNPSRALVAAAIREVIAAVERGKDKEKSKGKKINKKDVDASTASAMHMGLLEKYRDFHDQGNSLMGFRTIVDGIPDDSAGDVLAARKECAKAWAELESAVRNCRGAYSSLMAALSRY